MEKLFDRVQWAKENLKPFETDYRIVFEADMDVTCAILIPDPYWMAMALHGGLLPSVEAYHNLEVVDGKVTNGHILHNHTIGALTEEEAIDYLLRKDTPDHVWKDTSRNRPLFNVTKKEFIPANRTYRNAFEMNLDHQRPIKVDFAKAKHLQKKAVKEFYIQKNNRKRDLEPFIAFDDDAKQEYEMINAMRPELAFDRLNRAKTLSDLDHALPAHMIAGA